MGQDGILPAGWEPALPARRGTLTSSWSRLFSLPRRDSSRRFSPPPRHSSYTQGPLSRRSHPPTRDKMGRTGNARLVEAVILVPQCGGSPWLGAERPFACRNILRNAGPGGRLRLASPPRRLRRVAADSARLTTADNRVREKRRLEGFAPRLPSVDAACRVWLLQLCNVELHLVHGYRPTPWLLPPHDPLRAAWVFRALDGVLFGRIGGSLLRRTCEWPGITA